ncbi:tyrosine protein phosphatase [Bacillus sp. DNRA2]|uniref:tyrosine-protein phosphatase n=1 Tax=Bacillus sp. DNRA2 TaxID=2723053 RepID=UPI00145D0344|nr:CpsB/CapC family capsule biosynthesis tyrosine phosphatase [Bacillus sp. DNRA2]NMD70163.1 tyrosine protein phosphatase [Bacillus sp. DNRA2]
MIDVHCHILPNVDDGAENIQASMAMAREAVRQGITTIIATPHHKNNQYENPKPQILTKVTELNQALANEKIPLTVLPGQEIRISGEVLEDYQNQEILSLAHSNYFLIELPTGHVPRYTEKLLYDLQMEGLVPIIAHPERNQELVQSPDLLYQFVKKGALTQITAASVCGAFGKKIKQFSLQLIEANLTHFVASDAHNLVNRTFMMQQAYQQIESKYGIDAVYMFRENAELLVDGERVFKEMPERIKKKKIFGLF